MARANSRGGPKTVAKNKNGEVVTALEDYSQEENRSEGSSL